MNFIKTNSKTIVASLCLACSMTMSAATNPGIIPLPKTMSVKTGTLSLPTTLTIGGDALPDSIVAEAKKFAEVYTTVTGHAPSVQASNANATFTLVLDKSVAPEGYQLDITDSKATIKASTTAGFFYAFQTVRKLLPPEFMAGVQSSAASFSLPCVTIKDAPRFSYRGFMLDEARHFFGINEVKKLLDLMAAYKMNNFHWHLTDDQGWRIEIKKYPRLTSVGSIAPNSWFTDMKYGGYWTNSTYGPYYYTQEQIKEVVAYAKERHINIIPEIDMPGHFTAAMAAYPEYSCTPYGSHTVWSSGGISSDVMNVANPKAVQFAKDILKELCDLFPGEYIHIGGDECPDNAWKNNDECKKLYEEEKLTNYRQLQSRFIKQMADYLRNFGRKTAVWNEAITANGSDIDSIKAADVKVFCWNPAAASAKQAAQNGLDNVVTFYGPYYINRKQSTAADEPSGAGNGADSLRTTYTAMPVPSDINSNLRPYYTGVQATFWAEHVNERNYLEYLALPRLMAVAEAGWTEEAKKNYNDFKQRVIADTTYLNLAGFNYCRRDIATQKTSVVYPDKDSYYRIVTKATDNPRKGTCITLLYKDSPLLTQWSGKGAQVNRLWAAAQLAETDSAYKYQMWRFEPSPSDSTLFAFVCQAFPNGSVKANPTANNNTGRWDYDLTGKHYNFRLGTAGYGTEGSNHYYTIASDKATGNYVNASVQGQGYAVNLWSNPSDGNGGLWTFVSANGNTPQTGYDEFDYLQNDQYVTIANAVEGFNNGTLADKKNAQYLQWTSEGGTPDAPCNIWKVTSTQKNDDNTETITLQNVGTKRYIGNPVNNDVANIGRPVQMNASTASNLTLTYYKKTGDFTLTTNGKSLFPIPMKSDVQPGVVSGGSPIRPQGNAWTINRVEPIHVTCVDTDGKTIAEYYAVKKEGAFTAPELTNYQMTKVEGEGTAEITVTYKRTSSTVRLEYRDQNGGLIAETDQTVALGATLDADNPTLEYYTLDQPIATGLVINNDTTLTATYTTTALSGIKKVGDPALSLTDGRTYAIYDSSPTDLNRRGFRNVDPTGKVHQVMQVSDSKPGLVWQLSASGKGYTVKNIYTNQYIPQLQKSQPVSLSNTGGVFTFTHDDDGVAWKVEGDNGLYWDGLVDGMTGWNQYGHPYILYNYYVEPYFTVTVRCIDENRIQLSSTTNLVRAGDAYELVIPSFAGYTYQKTEGADQLAAVKDYATVTIYYTSSTNGVTEITTKDNRQKGIYNLNGMKLKKPVRGINIIDGRKVIIR